MFNGLLKFSAELSSQLAGLAGLAVLAGQSSQPGWLARPAGLASQAGRPGRLAGRPAHKPTCDYSPKRKSQIMHKQQFHA